MCWHLGSGLYRDNLKKTGGWGRARYPGSVDPCQDLLGGEELFRIAPFSFGCLPFGASPFLVLWQSSANMSMHLH